MSTRTRSIWIVVLADVVFSYAYVFLAHTLIASWEFRVAPLGYWLTQSWVYFVIAPVAAVASWRGARQVLDAWAGRPRWWRLPVEGVLIGVACMLLIASPFPSGSSLARGIRDVIILCGGLGMVLTCVNGPLARRLRPDAASGDGDAPHAPGLTPGVG